MSAANSVPLGRQGNLDRFVQISSTLGEISENDAVAREIEGYDGLPMPNRRKPKATEQDTTRSDWAATDAPQGLPPIPQAPTQQTEQPIPKTPKATAHGTTPTSRRNLSPLRFPTPATDSPSDNMSK